MKDHDLEKIATLLKESDQYKVIKRYQKPESIITWIQSALEACWGIS